ncbi:chitotriosidase-1-like isoform X2 [Dreissena polymorpha]|uniref:Chitinase n=1 Tax=Dreissena polymorpha TaxID=45954 RepID=A0A9D4LRT9_DREPO|nr:chitotriosidase-1-like isoform X2 [Dreissena polymorpha]KAH3863080.1 hypothetical protein DPMN_026058 [Dreissena polymorpha]
MMWLLALAVLATAAYAQDARKRVCYYSNWSQYRPGIGKYTPGNIDAFLCTHLIYSFAKLDNNKIAMYEWNDDQLYTQFNNLKKVNPNLKTLLAIGGWNAGSTVFSNLVADSALRKQFAVHATSFLRQWGFDGLDLDWEYPANRGGPPADKVNFISWIKDILAEFNADAAQSGRPRLLLTAAVGAGKATIDPAYDIPEMARLLDFINLMSYDLHGAWETFTGHNAPLYARADESGEQAQLNLDWAARYWVQKGCPKSKLIIGLATYGRSFRLSNQANYGMGAPTTDPAPTGPYTMEAGFLAYYEVCLMLQNGAVRHWHSEHLVPYATQGSTWVGYDDKQSFIIKLEYIREQGYGGAMIWNMDLDDFQQTCSSSDRPYPLMSLMEEVLGGYSPPSTVSPTTAPTTRPGETTTATRPPSTTVSTGAPTAAPTAGPGGDCSGVNDGYYPHPTDCSRYIRCVWGVAHVHQCAAGLLWSQQRQYCDWASNVECNTQTTQGPSTSTTQKPTTQAPTTQKPTTQAPTTQKPTTQAPTTQKTTTVKPTTGPTKLPADFCANKADGIYQHPGDCTAFVNCHAGVNRVMFCATGLLFNPAINNCDWASNVDCSAKTEPRVMSFCQNKREGLYEDPNNCAKYYKCAHGRTELHTCPTGTKWSTTIGLCDWTVNVNCGSRP